MSKIHWRVGGRVMKDIEYEYWYDDKGRVVGKVPLIDVVGLEEE